MSTPAESSVRFELGIGGGVKVFHKPRWGILFHVEYLPMVMQAEVQRLVCSGGCIVVLKGRLASQFTVSAGRFSDSKSISMIEAQLLAVIRAHRERRLLHAQGRFQRRCIFERRFQKSSASTEAARGVVSFGLLRD